MDNVLLSGGISELQEAKAAILQTNDLQAAYNAASAEVSGKEKDLESQKKYVSDKVNTVIKDRRSELKKTLDEQVDNANKDLRTAEKKRKAAKSDAVQDRISNETANLVEENKNLKRKTKSIFLENRIPRFCNTRFYYALYAPKKASDFLILILTILITFGAIPNIVCMFINTEKTFIKVLVYLAIVVFFVALYFLFFVVSKRNTNGKVLEEARPLRTEIVANKKLIKQTSRLIEKDKDESAYGLEEHDSEIAGLQQILNDQVQKREAALKEFDEQTAVQLREEIVRENQPTIDKMTEELIECRKDMEQKRARANQASEYVTNSYEVYLGKKNTTVDKIDGMIALMQEGKASTIMEALDLLNGEIKSEK